MKSDYERYVSMTESRLAECFLDHGPLAEAMRYSLLAGGKRIRPALTLGFCEACGGRAEEALGFACGVEMLHTYSLIHDDLPCMDDDGLRRGKPTSHRVFGEWRALVAGDALQAAAFEELLDCPLPAEKRAAAALVLARAAGARGMCGGQALDMEGEGRTLTLAELEEIDRGKTAALITASALLGCIAAGASKERMEAAKRYGAAMGAAFQIRDDLLDAEGASAELGKSVGKDAQSGKATYYTIFGADSCRGRVKALTHEAKAALSVFERPGFLLWLADAMEDRKN